MLKRHGDPDMLSLDKGSSKLAQAPTSQTALIEVERYDGDPPAITVFDEPPTAEA